MSWDVILIRFDQHYETVSALPKDVQTVPLGERAKVEATIQEVFPDTAWDDPRDWGIWGAWDSPMGSIKFSTGSDEHTIDSITLHVRAAGGVVPGIMELTERLGCQAISASSGEFLNADTALQGITAWRDYRDRVIAAATQPSEPPRFWKAFRSNPLLMLKVLFCNRNARR